MEIKKTIVHERYVTKFTAEENGEVLGRAFLYFIYNGLHEEPGGLLEDVYVEAKHRSRGIGRELALEPIHTSTERSGLAPAVLKNTANRKENLFPEIPFLPAK